jgi:hypothetical protein
MLGGPGFVLLPSRDGDLPKSFRWRCGAVDEVDADLGSSKEF